MCVCHNGHQLFEIGYHFKIFRPSGKKVNFTPGMFIYLMVHSFGIMWVIVSDPRSLRIVVHEKNK